MSEYSIDFDLTQYPTLYAATHSEAFIRVVRGPAGSAKTSWMFVELMRRACEQAPGQDGVRRTKWGVGRLTYSVLISNTVQSAKKTLGPLFKVRESIPPTVTGRFDLPDGTRVETTFEFLSLDGDDAMNRLLGGEWTGFALDEVSELPEKILHAVIRRVGRYPSASMGHPSWVGILAVQNGPLEGHWTQKYELGENAEQLAELAAEMARANPHLPKRPFLHMFAQPPGLLRPASKDPADADGKWRPNPRAENVQNLPGGYGYYFTMLADPDDARIKAFVEGDYAPLKKGTLVFPGFRKDRHVLKSADLRLPEGVPLGLSFDFGRTPVCGVWVQTGSGRLVMVEEVMGEDISVEGLVRQHLRPLLSQKYRTSRIDWATGDPSGSFGRDNVDLTPFQVLWDLGIPVEDPGSNNLPPRLEAVNARLSRLDGSGNPMVQIRDNCTFTIEALSRTYIYEQVSGTSDAVRDLPTKTHVNWASDLCLAAGTRVSTPGGPKRIEDIRAGDLVDTPLGPRPVRWAGQTHACAEVMALDLPTGRLVGTPDHPVWVEGAGFVRLDEVQYADVLSGDPQWQPGPNGSTASSTTSTITGITFGRLCAKVVSAVARCTGRSGNTTTVPSRTDSTSTTSTTSGGTTGSRTSNWSTPRSTLAAICWSAWRAATWMWRGVWQRHRKRPRPGTGARKVARGTASTRAGYSQTSPGTLTSVFSVGAPTKGSPNTESVGSAVPSASPLRDATVELMMWNESASSAAALSLSTGMPRPSVAVRAAAAASPAGSASVHDLTVEEARCFYAEGVLVHNCDQVQYACLYHPLTFAQAKPKRELPKLPKRWA